jgi:hypothetical protein
MTRILQRGATPFAGMTSDEAVRSEWCCWFADTLHELDKGKSRQDILREAWLAGISFRSRVDGAP